jgi:hypothetical protein
MTNAPANWTGTVSSRFAVPTAAVFAVIGIIMSIALAPILTWAGSIACGALVVVAGICVLAVYKIRATVSDTGLTIEYFPFLGCPTTRINASEIQSVEAIHAEPREHAGWGYRGSIRLYGRAALNLRRGPGIALTLTKDRSFVLTIDDADGATGALGRILTLR